MGRVILLVDDDAGFRESVRQTLELRDYDLVEVSDGKQALAAIETEQVSLVVTDILMPNMEGNELAMTIKERRPDLKIIGMTGGGRLGSAEEVAGDCVYPLFEVILKKPFLAEDLTTAIDSALS